MRYPAGRKPYGSSSRQLSKGPASSLWLYITAPHSAITHACEFLPAQTRNPGDSPLEENGLGNAEFNSRHKDCDGYDYAYKILSVYALRKPAKLTEMRAIYEFKPSTRSLVHPPRIMGIRHVARADPGLEERRRALASCGRNGAGRAI